MLTEEDKRRISEAAGLYEQHSAAVPEALRIVQDARGWVDDQSVRDIAELLEVSPEAVDDVATFYSLIYRRPVGRHVILLCDSISCWLTGFTDVRAHLREKLGIDFGQTTPDGRFTLLPAACLGHCEQAPAMMIDRTIYGNLTPQRIEQALEKHQ
jgi:NADH-quinone oxidoreductase subunit E